MPVFFLHPGQGLVDGGVAPRLPAGELPLLVYPSAHAAVDAHLLQLRFELGRKAQTFDCNQPRHILRIDAGIAQREIGAEGMGRSEEHTSELQSLMRISYAVFCLKNKKKPERKTQQ